jgi:hypothetical protein
VFELRGDLGLQDESISLAGLVGVIGQHLLQGDFSFELRIERDPNPPESTSGMRPNRAEPARRRGITDFRACAA